jgi:peptidoglycan-associated lipoprotein
VPASGEIPVASVPRDAAEDKVALHDHTVYFDFDSSALKSREKTKVEAVVEYLKSNPTKLVRVEGNCDERGTEEYNRALGERRALAVREEIVRMGIESSRVVTLSNGKDQPAETGHDDAAWAKNRRDEFIVLIPRTAP